MKGTVVRKLVTFGGNNELVGQLVNHGVRFLVVGGLAVHFYNESRMADDLDLLIEQSPENADRLFAAFVALKLTPQFSKNLIAQPSQTPKQLSLKPTFYADLLTLTASANFEDEWKIARIARLGSSEIRVAPPRLLIRMKESSGRQRDIDDVDLISAIEDA